jgi:hypothetical protein
MAGRKPDGDMDDGYSLFSMFLVVSGVLTAAVLAPLLLVMANPSRSVPKKVKPRPSAPST